MITKRLKGEKMNAITIQSHELQPVNFDVSLFERYIRYTDVKDNTLDGYVVCLKQFINWLQATGTRHPERDDIRAYKQFLEEQGYTAGTKQRYLRVVKHFFKWTASEGLYPNVADGVKTAKVKNDNTKKEAFIEEDIRAILQSIDRSTTTGKRDYAMLLLAVTGGLRTVEIHRADIGDMQTIKGQRVLYIQGKGRDEKDEYIKLVQEVAKAIDEYLQTRASRKKNEPLFTGTSNRAQNARITTQSISRIIKTTFREAGFDSDKLTAHSLRHTSNTLLFKSGADLYQVQKHARHADPKTTEIYLHAVEREGDQSEQAIYNQIFDIDFDIRKEIDGDIDEILQIVNKLSPSQRADVLEYVRTLAKNGMS